MASCITSNIPYVESIELESEHASVDTKYMHVDRGM
jgi:hypothetical protein